MDSWNRFHIQWTKSKQEQIMWKSSAQLGAYRKVDLSMNFLTISYIWKITPNLEYWQPTWEYVQPRQK